MALFAPSACLPADARDDIEYVQASFVPMASEVEDLVERGILPLATYALPDGTPMVPRDHAALLRDADGDPHAVESCFRRRFLAAGGDPAEVEGEYRAWLSGEYGACLRSTTPEGIVVKAALMRAITGLLSAPAPDDSSWCTATRSAVNALDALEMPFAAWDRQRFGAPSSRDRLVTGTRERFPALWA